jgi:hypothetical protein
MWVFENKNTNYPHNRQTISRSALERLYQAYMIDRTEPPQYNVNTLFRRNASQNSDTNSEYINAMRQMQENAEHEQSEADDVFNALLEAEPDTALPALVRRLRGLEVYDEPLVMTVNERILYLQGILRNQSYSFDYVKNSNTNSNSNANSNANNTNSNSFSVTNSNASSRRRAISIDLNTITDLTVAVYNNCVVVWCFVEIVYKGQRKYAQCLVDDVDSVMTAYDTAEQRNGAEELSSDKLLYIRGPVTMDVISTYGEALHFGLNAPGGGKPKKRYNGKMYVVRTGTRGGKYIMVNKKKMYIK